ncbi:hypothetical protein BU17DRAFT_97728 [Hysterangium stoloniferum]|nr:hypothetical protein BU17DRAFT_97728 [Hysterangium stoloniferum]
MPATSPSSSSTRSNIIPPYSKFEHPSRHFESSAAFTTSLNSKKPDLRPFIEPCYQSSPSHATENHHSPPPRASHRYIHPHPSPPPIPVRPSPQCHSAVKPRKSHQKAAREQATRPYSHNVSPVKRPPCRGNLPPRKRALPPLALEEGEKARRGCGEKPNECGAGVGSVDPNVNCTAAVRALYPPTLPAFAGSYAAVTGMIYGTQRKARR